MGFEVENCYFRAVPCLNISNNGLREVAKILKRIEIFSK